MGSQGDFRVNDAAVQHETDSHKTNGHAQHGFELKDTDNEQKLFHPPPSSDGDGILSDLFSSSPTESFAPDTPAEATLQLKVTESHLVRHSFESDRNAKSDSEGFEDVALQEHGADSTTDKSHHPSHTATGKVVPKDPVNHSKSDLDPSHSYSASPASQETMPYQLREKQYGYGNVPENANRGSQGRISQWINLWSGKPPKASAMDKHVSKTRPSMLPPKSKAEDKKHLQQHQQMLDTFKARSSKDADARLHRRDKREESMRNNSKFWEDEILKEWGVWGRKTGLERCWEGIPPKYRGAVWIKAIGNHSKVPKDWFAKYLESDPRIEKNKAFLSQPLSSLHPNPPDTEAVQNLQQAGNTLVVDAPTTPAPPALPTPTLPSLPSMPQKAHAANARAVSSRAIVSNPIKFRYKRPLQTINPGNASRAIAFEPTNPGHPSTSSHSSPDAGETHGAPPDVDGDAHSLTDSDPGSQEEPSKDVMFDLSIPREEDTWIDDDIQSTIPCLAVFQPQSPFYSPCKSVLRAHEQYRKDIAYTKGTAFMAGILLLNMEAPDAFIALTNLIHKSDILSALHARDEAKLVGYYKIFNVLFADLTPKVYMHFKNLAISPSQFLPKWFTTLFCSILPLEYSSRLLDVLVFEGDIILFQTAFAVLRSVEHKLWGATFTEGLNILSKGLVDANGQLEVPGSVMPEGVDAFINAVNAMKINESRWRELCVQYVWKA